MPHIRPYDTVLSAPAASDRGMRDADNAALHGVTVKTIRRWRREYQRRGKPRGQTHTQAPCPRCDGAELDEAAYTELLGWYLGDGHISRGRRDVWNLHVVNDLKHVLDNERLRETMRRVKPGGKPHVRLAPGCLITTVSWKHWVCLIPQHGPGRKHDRPIILEEWQREIVAREPGPVPARAVPLRRLPGEELDPQARRWADEEVRLPAVAVHQQLRRHPPALLLGARLGGDPVAAVELEHHLVARREGVARLDELIGLKE